MLFGIILGATVFCTFAMLVRDGMWSNTIKLIQVLLSGLIAFGFYQPLTILIDEQTEGEYTYALDIVVVWGLYVISILVFTVLMEGISKKKLRFIPPQVDTAVGPLIGLVTGCLLAGFVGATLHVSPLPRDGLANSMNYTRQQIDEAPIYALDITWLNIVEAASKAGFAGPEEFSVTRFVTVYGERRAKYENADGLRVDRAR